MRCRQAAACMTLRRAERWELSVIPSMWGAWSTPRAGVVSRAGSSFPATSKCASPTRSIMRALRTTSHHAACLSPMKALWSDNPSTCGTSSTMQAIRSRHHRRRSGARQFGRSMKWLTDRCSIVRATLKIRHGALSSSRRCSSTTWYPTATTTSQNAPVSSMQPRKNLSTASRQTHRLPTSLTGCFRNRTRLRLVLMASLRPRVPSWPVQRRAFLCAINSAARTFWRTYGATGA